MLLKFKKIFLKKLNFFLNLDFNLLNKYFITFYSFFYSKNFY
jgi:hypothetical protein